MHLAVSAGDSDSELAAEILLTGEIVYFCSFFGSVADGPFGLIREGPLLNDNKFKHASDI